MCHLSNISSWHIKKTYCVQTNGQSFLVKLGGTPPGSLTDEFLHPTRKNITTKTGGWTHQFTLPLISMEVENEVDDSNHPIKGHSSEKNRCVNVYLAKFSTLPETNMTPENRPSPKQGNSSSNQFSGATVEGKNPANQLISLFLYPRWCRISSINSMLV